MHPKSLDNPQIRNQSVPVTLAIQSFTSAMAVKTVGYCHSQDRLQEVIPTTSSMIEYSTKIKHDCYLLSTMICREHIELSANFSTQCLQNHYI